MPGFEIPLVEILRELNKDLKKQTVRIIILPLITQLIKFHLEKHWGKYPKVAVLGPYENNGEEILHIVAQKCAQRGWIAIMGVGFYHPEKPFTFHEIPELLPPLVVSLLPVPEFQFLFYRSILPAVVDKATSNLSFPLRSTHYELEGLHEESFRRSGRLPVLGYVIAPNISQASNCPYVKNHTENKGGLECNLKDPFKCPLKAQKPPFCIFYDIVKIPLIVMHFFMTESSWRIVALDNLERIDFYLDSFLK